MLGCKSHADRIRNIENFFRESGNRALFLSPLKTLKIFKKDLVGMKKRLPLQPQRKRRETESS